MQEIIQQSAENVDFYVSGEKINRVKQFKYLGRILSDDDDDIYAVEAQLKKARMTWGRIGKVIKKRARSNPKLMSMFYKVIVQTVLLYGSESWTINSNIMKKLTSFHRRCARFISGRHIRCVDDVWIYPDTKTTMEITDLLSIEEYMLKRKDTVRLYVRTTDILNKCKFSRPAPRNSNQTVWWTDEKVMENEIVTEIP